MSGGTLGKSRDMDLLKSILDNDASDDPDHVVLHLPTDRSRTPSRSPRRGKSPRANMVNHRANGIIGSLPTNNRILESDTDTSTLDSELWLGKGKSSKKSNRAKRNIRSAKGRRTPHAVSHREMLDSKYQELRQLLYDRFRRNKFKLDPDLVSQAKELMRRYQLAQDGQIPVDAILKGHTAGPQHMPSSAASTQTATERRVIDQPEESFILIDGTGPQVRTRRVTFATEEEESTCTEDPDYAVPQEELDVWQYQRSRAPTRKPRPKPPVAQRVVAKPPRKPSPRRTSPDKSQKKKKTYTKKSSKRTGSSDRSSRDSSSSSSRERKDNYSSDSDSYSSRSSSRSRSRSRSKGRKQASDHHVKHSDNPRLLEWLKEKNKIMRQRRKEDRLKRRAEKQAHLKDLEEKEHRQEQSEEKVKAWMVQKKKEQRLLRRKQMSKNCISDSSLKSDGAGSVLTDDVSSQVTSAASTPRVQSAKKSYPRPLSAALPTFSPNKKPRPKTSIRRGKALSKPEEVASVTEPAPEDTDSTPVSNTQTEEEPEKSVSLEPKIKTKRRKNSDGDYTLPRRSLLIKDSKKTPEKSASEIELSTVEDMARRPSFEAPSPPRPSKSPAPPSKPSKADLITGEDLKEAEEERPEPQGSDRPEDAPELEYHQQYSDSHDDDETPKASDTEDNTPRAEEQGNNETAEDDTPVNHSPDSLKQDDEQPKYFPIVGNSNGRSGSLVAGVPTGSPVANSSPTSNTAPGDSSQNRGSPVEGNSDGRSGSPVAGVAAGSPVAGSSPTSNTAPADSSQNRGSPDDNSNQHPNTPVEDGVQIDDNVFITAAESEESRSASVEGPALSSGGITPSYWGATPTIPEEEGEEDPNAS